MKQKSLNQQNLTRRLRRLLVLFAVLLLPLGARAYTYLEFDKSTLSFSTKSIEAFTVVSSSTTSMGTSGQETWYILSTDVTISLPIEISGHVKLLLCDGCTLTASQGIVVPNGTEPNYNSLSIYGQTNGTGKLIASAREDFDIQSPFSAYYSAAIGGSYYVEGSGQAHGHIPCGSIYIHGGQITADASNQIHVNDANQVFGGLTSSTGIAAGIGGCGIGTGSGSDGGIVEIYGGTVTAIGSSTGAGIGGGYGGKGGTVKIYGGTVTATGGSDGSVSAPGIGAGNSGSENGSLILYEGVTCYGDANTNPPTTLLATGSGSNVSTRYQYMKTCPTSYGITVAGVQVTVENASDILYGTANEGKVSYTHNSDGTGTLYLNEASLTDKIRMSREEALTINLSGANTIEVNDSSAILASFNTVSTPTPTLIFSGNGYITLTPNQSYKTISGFNVDLTLNGMQANGDYTQNGTTVTIAKKYPLKVMNNQVTSANAENILNNYVTVMASFEHTSDGEDILTLTDAGEFRMNGGNQTNYIGVESGFENLYVRLQGAVVISCRGTNDIAFKGIVDGAKVTFITDATSPGSLFIAAHENLLFEDITPQYNDLMYFDTGINQYLNNVTDNYEDYVTARIMTSPWEGSGTTEDPFLIKTVDDLKNLAAQVGIISNQKFRLDDNIVLSDVDDFSPIGEYSAAPFKGTFDGNNKTISGLTYENSGNMYATGLFAYVGDENTAGTIKNLVLKNCSFSGGDGNIGAVVGYLNNGSIEDCTVTNCTVTSGNTKNVYAGGIVGTIISGSVSNCTVNGTTSVNAHTTNDDTSGICMAGGIAGQIDTGGNYVSGCTVTGTTTISSYRNPADNTSSLIAGAIYGSFADNGNSVPPAFTGNYYYYDVTTSTKKGSADAVVKSGYTQRGFGAGDDEPTDDGIVLYTQRLTLAPNTYYTIEGVDDTYYKSDGNALYVAPEQTAQVLVTPQDVYLPTAANATYTPIGGTEQTITATKAADSYTYSFEMPDNAATFNLTSAIDLANANFTYEIDDAYYTGTAIEPTTVKATGIPGVTGITELTNGTDFTVTNYQDDQRTDLGTTAPCDAGTYTVTIEGIGSYTGTKDVEYNIIMTYDLWVEGKQVTEKNKDAIITEKSSGNATVTFDGDHTLTLNGANIDGAIESGLGDLTIHLSGTNILSDNGKETSLIKSTNNGSLTFETNETSGGSLEFKGVDGDSFANPISGFSSVESIIYEGALMTDGQSIGTTEHCVTYNATDKVLTFNSYSGTLTSQIQTGVTGLTIKFEGTSTLDASTLDYPFKAMTNTASIEFVTENGGGMNVTSKKSDTLFEDFGDGKVTYDGLACYYDSGNNIWRFETLPDTPTIAYDGNHTYLDTDEIEITNLGYTTIFYTWGDATVGTEYTHSADNPTLTEYNGASVQVQNGTLRAWSGKLIDGNRYLMSEAASQAFTVKKDIASCTVTLPESAIYTGTAFVPTVKESSTSETALTLGTDFTVIYKKVVGTKESEVQSMVDAGTYKITFTGTGNYGGTKEIASFQIAQATPTLTFSQPTATITFGNESAFVKPTLTTTPEGLEVIYGSGTKTIAEVNETTGVITPLAVGEVEISATFEGNDNYTSTSTSYTLTVAKGTPTITNAPAAKTLTYTSAAQALVEAGTVSAGTLMYSKSLTGTFTESIPEETNAGTYNVYYKVAGNANYNSIDANETNKVSVTINPATITEVTLTQTSFTYSGEEQTATVSAVKADDLTLGTNDYEVSNNKATNKGSYTLTVTAKENGNFTGSKTADFTINAKTLTEDMVSLSAESLQYNGATQKPEVTVTDGNFITANDYTITNEGGKDTGTYYVTVTGKNNYTGEVTKSFDIVNRTLNIGVNGDVQFADGQTWASFYSTTESLELPEGIMAYIVTAVNSTSATVKAINYVPKDVPVFLENNSTATTTNSSAEGNLLKGTTASTPVSGISGTVYALHNNILMQVTTGSIPAGRCYLQVNSASGARQLSIINDEGGSTSIQSLEADEENDTDEWYMMDGRKLQKKPAKEGLYIKNGKKIVIKRE